MGDKVFRSLDRGVQLVQITCCARDGHRSVAAALVPLLYFNPCKAHSMPLSLEAQNVHCHKAGIDLIIVVPYSSA